MIPRLPPATNPFEVTVTVGVNLRPYFEVWYNRTKRDGETPADFALRKLKESALHDYLEATVPTERDAIQDVLEAEKQALSDDVALLESEVD